MKFIVSSSALWSRLQSISRVINSKNSLPVLDCFLFDLKSNILSITGSDGETTLVTSIEVIESDVDARFCINSKTILESMKEISEQPLTFDINLENMEIIAHYQNGVFNIVGQNADEYPQSISLDEQTDQLIMAGEVMLNGISRSLFATADDELRPVMNGIYFDITTEDLTFVASDGHKLVRCKTFAVKGNEQKAFILPKKPATLLKNLLPKEAGDVTLQFNERNAVVKLENYKITCRLIEGRYPNYNSVIPLNNPYRVTIDRVTLLGALKRVLVFSSQSSSLIKIHMEANQLVVSGQDTDFSTSAEESIICQYDGMPMSIGFKGTFFADILNNLESQEVVIELADPGRAGVIVPAEQKETEDVLMLLMPMMLND